MSAQQQVLQRMTNRLTEVLVGMHRARVASFVRLVVGVILAQQVSLPRVAEALGLGRKTGTTERQLRRLVANPKLVVEEVWQGVRPALLADWAHREVVLVLDATPHGKTRSVLTVGIVAHGRVLPLGNRVMPQQTRWDERLVPAITPLCDGIAQAMPTGAAVTLVADRGLSCAPLIDLCTRLGWHYVLRISVSATSDHRVRFPDGTIAALWSLVDRHRWQRVAPGAIFSCAGWRTGVITVRWEERYDEPWVLFSDRVGGSERVRDYRKRHLIEATFQDLKRRGVAVEESHVRALDRIERLLLAVDLGYWWLAYLGGTAIRHGTRPLVDRTDRRDCSRQTIGSRLLLRAITTATRISLPLHRRNGRVHYPALLA